MGSSHIRRERRLLFGPTKVEQHVDRWVSPREGGGLDVWLSPCYIRTRELALSNYLRERAERSRPHRRRSRRGQRSGHRRSRAGKARVSEPERPPKTKGDRFSKRIARQRAWVTKVSDRLGGMTRRLVEGRDRDDRTRTAYRNVSKAYRHLASLVATWGDFPTPISFTHFYYLHHNEGPWTGEEDIFTSYGWTRLSDTLQGTNITLRRSTDVRPPSELSVTRRGNKTPRPPVCRRCGDFHVRGPCPTVHAPVQRHRGPPCDCPISNPTVRGLCVNCSRWVNEDLRGVPRAGSRRRGA